MIIYLWRDDIVLRAPHHDSGLAGVSDRDAFEFSDDRALDGLICLLVALLTHKHPPVTELLYDAQTHRFKQWMVGAH